MAHALIEFAAADFIAGPSPASRAAPAPGGDSGYSLGWDHARHGLVPPAAHLHAGNPLRAGWEAGKSAFGRRALAPTPRVRQWLQLRLGAWLRGLAFDTVQVTPHYLGQIEVRHCPVTRRQLGPVAAAGAEEAQVVRVCVDAGFAAGNLAMLGATAAMAADRVRHDGRRALKNAETIDADPANAALDGLDAAAWRRLAVLLSFTTPLSHDEAARLPLHLLPPNRLRLLNPVQGLQVLLTLRLASAGWGTAIRALAEAMPGEARRAEFSRFVAALVPRLLEAGTATASAAPSGPTRPAIEDAWSHPLVQARWQRFALALTEAQAQTLLQHAAALAPAGQQVQLLDRDRATEGWALTSAGLAQPDDAAGRGPAATALARSAWRPAGERGAAALTLATLQ